MCGKLSRYAHFADKETEAQRGRPELRVCFLLQAWPPNTPASMRLPLFCPQTRATLGAWDTEGNKVPLLTWAAAQASGECPGRETTNVFELFLCFSTILGVGIEQWTVDGLASGHNFPLNLCDVGQVTSPL